MTDVENFWLEGVPNPVLNEGDTPQTGSTMCGYIKEAMAITSNCKNPELAARWLDYFYTKEGMLLNAYGIEGETYELLPDGTPQYTELVTNNPDGYGMLYIRQQFLWLVFLGALFPYRTGSLHPFDGLPVRLEQSENGYGDSVGSFDDGGRNQRL